MKKASYRPPLRQTGSQDRFTAGRRFSGSRLGRAISGLCVGLLAFAALSILAVSVLSFVPVFITPLVAIRAVEAGFNGHQIHFSKVWVPIEDMSPSLLRAAIASEDFRFTEHNGFDFDAIERAMRSNEQVERKGRGRIRGASTISQQTAKNVFLFPSRTWVRKGLEAWMTILIETIWTKRRILEVYLNVVEIGDGVYGVEAASRTYFHKSAKNLNASEAALIVAVLPSPRKLRVDRPSSYLRYRQSAILRRLSYVDLPD